MSERILTPNIKKLLIRFIAIEAIPSGGGLADGLLFLTDAKHRKEGIERAMNALETALAIVKTSPDNPYGDDDEAIAAAILDRLEHTSGGETRHVGE